MDIYAFEFIPLCKAVLKRYNAISGKNPYIGQFLPFQINMHKSIEIV
jgi:hypothetical protein